jgi:hypothetical protein
LPDYSQSGNYSYPSSSYNSQMMSPQQRQQMQMYANQLIPYNTPVQTPMAGLGQMATAAVNGMIQNPGNSSIFGGNNSSAHNILSGLFGNGTTQAPLQLSGSGTNTPNTPDASPSGVY